MGGGCGGNMMQGNMMQGGCGGAMGGHGLRRRADGLCWHGRRRYGNGL